MSVTRGLALLGVLLASLSGVAWAGNSGLTDGADPVLYVWITEGPDPIPQVTIGVTDGVDPIPQIVFPAGPGTNKITDGIDPIPQVQVLSISITDDADPVPQLIIELVVTVVDEPDPMGITIVSTIVDGPDPFGIMISLG